MCLITDYSTFVDLSHSRKNVPLVGVSHYLSILLTVGRCVQPYTLAYRCMWCLKTLSIRSVCPKIMSRRSVSLTTYDTYTYSSRTVRPIFPPSVGVCLTPRRSGCRNHSVCRWVGTMTTSVDVPTRYYSVSRSVQLLRRRSAPPRITPAVGVPHPVDEAFLNQGGLRCTKHFIQQLFYSRGPTPNRTYYYYYYCSCSFSVERRSKQVNKCCSNRQSLLLWTTLKTKKTIAFSLFSFFFVPTSPLCRGSGTLRTNNQHRARHS